MKKSKFSDEQIVRILEEPATSGSTQAEVCRKHGISENTFYAWKKKFAGMRVDVICPHLEYQS